MFSGTQFYKNLRDEILIKYDTTEEETAMIKKMSLTKMKLMILSD